MRTVIAVDGPSASGKSSVSKEIARRLNLEYIDSGKLYRAITVYCLNNDLNTEKEIIENLNEIEIDLKDDKIYLNSKDITDEVYHDEVSVRVPEIACIKEVREKLLTIQRELAKSKNIIMDGRDITSHVLKDTATLKIYLDADVKVRAKRRYAELKDEEDISFEQILSELKERDNKDKNRKIAPLKKTKDSIIIDSSNIKREEVIKKIINLSRG